MLALHIALTPLAGAPIRIVNALNKHTNWQARLINLLPTAYGKRTFPEDLIWDNDKILAISLIKKADIIVAHHPIDLVNNKFGIDFKKVVKPSCKFIQHFHSNRFAYGIENPILNGYDAQSVIPHCPERTFLDFKILPNIIPINDEYLLPKISHSTKPKVVFSVSTKRSRYKRRWDTKGYPEVSKKLKKFSKKIGFEYIEISNTPYYEAMRIKRDADIVIGDVVTGSFHLTELEGLSQGKAVFSFLDGRSLQTFMQEFHCTDIPFVNVEIEEIEGVLREIISKNLYHKIGEFSRKWIEKYYDDSHLILRHIDFYNDVINGGNILRANVEDFSSVKKFLYNDVNDLIWKQKRDNASFFKGFFNKKIRY